MLVPQYLDPHSSCKGIWLGAELPRHGPKGASTAFYALVTRKVRKRMPNWSD